MEISFVSLKQEIENSLLMECNFVIGILYTKLVCYDPQEKIRQKITWQLAELIFRTVN